jgi:spore germination cell wall hydrolase CwlJ-like protein
MNYDSDDLQSMALCLWREARGEQEIGMQAVACVIVNRANAWAAAMADPIHFVIYAKNQFTSMSVSSDPEYNLQPAPDDPQYAFAESICEPTINGAIADPTHGALYYAYLKASTSGWFARNISGADGKGTPEHPLLAVIGRQNFYR